MSELGICQIPGPRAAMRICEYLRTCTNLEIDEAETDETPWCAAFVGWCLERSGVKGTASARATSYRDWGVRADIVRSGTVAVIAWPNGTGHVGFVDSFDLRSCRINLLGGNQKDQVCVAPFLLERVIALRNPR